MSSSEREATEKSDHHHTPCSGEFYYKQIPWNAYTNFSILKKVEAFDYGNNDVMVITFPRSGTTLTQEIVWQIRNKATIERGHGYGDIDARFPFLEFKEPTNPNDMVDLLTSMTVDHPGGRLIKTHCPLPFLEPKLSQAKPKIILVMRNPKDVCVSLFHFYRGLEMYGPWPGEWPEFVEMFLNGSVMCGSWFMWNRAWWLEAGCQWGYVPQSKTHGWPMLVLNYEQLVSDPAKQISSIAEFLGEPLTSGQLETVMTNCRFDSMFRDDGLNLTDPTTGFRFIRRGKIGNWKEHFTSEQSEQFDRIYQSTMSGIGLELQYE